WGFKAAAAVVFFTAIVLLAQHEHEFPAAALPEKQGPLRKALVLLRGSKTVEARAELNTLRKAKPDDPELLYQIARSYLLDFYREQLPEKRLVSLALAMEELNEVLKRDGNYIPALRAKSVIHARAELLYYDPNLSYELAARIAKQEPNANGFLLNLSEW